jgi:hypothetical protein
VWIVEIVVARDTDHRVVVTGGREGAGILPYCSSFLSTISYLVGDGCVVDGEWRRAIALVC